MGHTHTPDKDELVGIGDAARIACLSVDTIRRYSDAGHLITFRTPGNQRRFRASDVRNLLTLSTPSSVTASSDGEGVSSLSP